MRWNLRMKAAERGVWKSTELRRMLAAAGLEISTGKMSTWWTGNPNTIRLDELDVICNVLECDPSALLIPEPDKVAARRPRQEQPVEAGRSSPVVSPRFGNPRSEPPV